MTTTTNKTINKANVASSSSFSFPNSTREEREEEEKNLKLERKITIATEGLLDYIVKRLSLEGKMTRNDILAYLDSLRKPEADKVWFYGYENGYCFGYSGPFENCLANDDRSIGCILTGLDPLTQLPC